MSLEYKEKQIDALELKINSLEQYNRSWSIRVNGLALTSEEELSLEKCVETVKRKVYNCLLLPILNGAVDNGDLEEVPTVNSLLENTHLLPSKDGPKPVIARFFVRSMKGLMFRHRQEYAPKAEPTTADCPGRYLYPFYEDLTRLTVTKMRAIKAQPDVES